MRFSFEGRAGVGARALAQPLRDSRMTSFASSKDPSRGSWMWALETTARATRDPTRTLPRAIAEWAELYGDRPALIGDEETYGFTGLAARINQYARWGLAQEIAKGATVALMM